LLRNFSDRRQNEWRQTVIKRGELRAIRIGRSVRIDRQLAEHKFAPREAAQRDAARKALDIVMQAGGRFVTEYHKMIPRIVPDKGPDAVRRLAGGAK